MRPTTHPVWLQWELDPPVFTVDEVTRVYRTQLAPARHHGLLRPTMRAAAIRCPDCGEDQPVTYVPDASGIRQGYIVCSPCGPTRIRPEQLDQLVFDTAAALHHLFADTRRSIEPLVSDRLWHIGRRTIASRSRELWFVRGIAFNYHDEILEKLKRRPRTIIFTPTPMVAEYWEEHLSNRVIAIEDVVHQDEVQLWLDWDAIEDQILEAADSHDLKPPSRSKRSSRVAKIELLVNELKQHLRTAASYAEATAELLPRPTQNDMAARTGMSKVDVSRCLKDDSANELRLLWQTAGDLDAVLRLPQKSLR
ncbi:hypothetical protein [Novipirellula caenicola]|uniref:Uncharacterized protein n=1 Tax=Novipirellula caenicola TaxID=1536901 RepID=A0ABP9VY62_9BACT